LHKTKGFATHGGEEPRGGEDPRRKTTQANQIDLKTAGGNYVLTRKSIVGLTSKKLNS